MSALSRRQINGAALLLLTLSACGQPTGVAASQTLYFSAIPDQNRTALEARYALVADYLTEHMGVQIEYVPTTSYEASVEAFVGGDLHLAWFGGVTGVQARRRVPGAEAIAQGKVDPTYVSYFIANVATGLEPSEDFPVGLEGLSFTFGSPSSTSGRVMPEFFVREATGKLPAEFFAGDTNVYSNSHDKTAKQVESGVVAAGALSYKVYDRMVAEGKIDPAKCRKIWTTPTYADYNWSVRPDLDSSFGEGFTARLKQTLIDCKDPQVLKALDREEGLISASNADFAALAETMRSVDM
ncbi:MAG: phosphonate transport system substrate-binding protein [Planctomycetota bacterium]|jgi:phosphonate transport system substrate-binding protein